ncbi:MAG TPA: phosphotransferase family protein [Actinomycetota bacterium]|nr:phosphotransferase family protein [Actinomycetota bacterium]
MNGPPPLVDPQALEDFLAHSLPGDGELVVQRHQAGHSNETFFVTRGDARWVLRRPPHGAFLPSAHDVKREHTVLSGLAGTSVRVPRTVLMCEDESVIGVPFYLMERVDGVVIRDDLPEWLGEDQRGRVGSELVDALVELHAVDPEPCGLGGFGKPTGYLERQLRRWKGQMELTLPFTRPLPDLESIGVWLEEHRPRHSETTLVHGDFKLDNVVFAAGPPPRLVAILDWEMSTLGDPLADLGWMVSFWREPGEDDGDVFSRTSRVTALSGFQSRAELVERYATATGRDVSELRWYTVLAVWKLAILLEGSYARHLAGMTDDPFFAEMEHRVPALAAKALEVAES